MRRTDDTAAEISASLGERVRLLRTKAGLGGLQLGLELGYPDDTAASSVANIESGKYRAYRVELVQWLLTRPGADLRQALMAMGLGPIDTEALVTAALALGRAAKQPPAPPPPGHPDQSALAGDLMRLAQTLGAASPLRKQVARLATQLLDEVARKRDAQARPRRLEADSPDSA